MTKSELEKENKALKAQIRALREENKVAEAAVSTGDADSVAYGITVVDQIEKSTLNGEPHNRTVKRLALVKINFSLDKNCAIIDRTPIEIDRRNPMSVKARNAITDEVIRKGKELKNG